LIGFIILLVIEAKANYLRGENRERSKF